MRFGLSIILFCFLIFLGGCSQIPGFGNSNEEIVSNKGLVVSFSTNDDFLPLVEYELILTNGGGNSIELREEDVSLLTLEKMQESSQGNVITQESIDEFYNEIFSNSGTLVLGPNQRRVYSGTFRVEDEYYFSSINSNANIILDIGYKYRTDITTNVVLDMSTRRIGNDRIIQAAPVTIDDLELFSVDSSNFRILFDVKNRGSASVVEIEDYEFYFGNNLLSCTPYGVNGDSREVNVQTISRSYSYLTFSCVLPQSYVSEREAVNTVFYGNFDYDYDLNFNQRISFPQQRQSSFE